LNKLFFSGIPSYLHLSVISLQRCYRLGMQENCLG
jgi:hypothetical protein